MLHKSSDINNHSRGKGVTEFQFIAPSCQSGFSFTVISTEGVFDQKQRPAPLSIPQPCFTFLYTSYITCLLQYVLIHLPVHCLSLQMEYNSLRAGALLCSLRYPKIVCAKIVLDIGYSSCLGPSGDRTGVTRMIVEHPLWMWYRAVQLSLLRQ